MGDTDPDSVRVGDSDIERDRVPDPHRVPLPLTDPVGATLGEMALGVTVQQGLGEELVEVDTEEEREGEEVLVPLGDTREEAVVLPEVEDEREARGEVEV